MASVIPFALVGHDAGRRRHEAGRCPALWVYRNAEGGWCVRKGGGPRERAFDSCAGAMSFAQAELVSATSYRLFVVRKDGRVTQEMLNPACHSV